MKKGGVTHKNGAMLPKKRGELIAYTHKNMNTTIQVRCYDTIMTLTTPLQYIRLPLNAGKQ